MSTQRLYVHLYALGYFCVDLARVIRDSHKMYYFRSIKGDILNRAAAR